MIALINRNPDEELIHNILFLYSTKYTCMWHIIFIVFLKKKKKISKKSPGLTQYEQVILF